MKKIGSKPLMKQLCKSFYVPLLFLMLSLGAKGQSPRFYVELEPLQFINEGWSVVGHYGLNEQFHLGANVFSSTLAEGQNDFVFDIRGNINLLAQQDLGINVSVRYFLKKQEVQQGWVLSLPLGWENWTLTDRETQVEDTYQFWYIGPRIGYLWYPFKKERFYLIGEAIALIPISRDEPIELGDAEIAINSFVPFPGLGLGISF